MMICLSFCLFRYNAISGCWNSIPTERPSFEDLRILLEKVLENDGHITADQYSTETEPEIAGKYILCIKTML